MQPLAEEKKPKKGKDEQQFFIFADIESEFVKDTDDDGVEREEHVPCLIVAERVKVDVRGQS